MIKYSLICDEEHTFATWFRSSADFEEQARRGLVECPTCQSTKVTKDIMAPSVARRDRAPAPAAATGEAPATGDGPEKGQSVALIDENAWKVRAALREIRDRILASSTDVGDQFADQARRMHDGEIPTQPIRGQTTGEEAKSLLDSGVPIFPIPVLPDDRN